MQIYRALWARTFVRLYDIGFAIAERAGLRELRRQIVGQASGVVVELGAGTGLNLSHYPIAVTRLVLTEPEPHMADKLQAKTASSQIPPYVCQAAAEALPIEDASVDTIVCTLVLCTVSDPDAVLREATRVLKPGGSLLFIEHVRARSPRLSKWQDRLQGPWGWFACGCQCNRDTLSTMTRSSLTPETVRQDRLRWICPLVRPLIAGVATR